MEKRCLIILWELLFFGILLFAVNACSLSPEATATAVPTAILEITVMDADDAETMMVPTGTRPPIFLSPEPRVVDVVSNTFRVEDSQGIQYSFTDSAGRLGDLLGILPNDELLFYGANGTVKAFDLSSVTVRSIFENVRRPLQIAKEANRVIFPLDAPSKQYPIYSADLSGGDLIFLGTTMGYFPFFSAADDSRVVVIEDKHLVVKIIEGGTVHTQTLESLEAQLGLDWQSYDFTNGPDYQVTPWIDFSISPDGRWLAIFDGKQAKLWLVTLDGEQIVDIPLDPRVLKNNSGDLGPYVRFSGWSPDSSRIAYREGIWTEQPFSPYELKVVDTSGNPPVQITSAETGIGGYLAWSFDSQYIAFSFVSWRDISDEQLGIERAKGSDLYIANSDGTDSRKVAETHHTGIYWYPSKHAVFFGCWNGDNLEYCLVDLEE